MCFEKNYNELRYTVQIGNFLRIHVTKGLADYLPHFLGSAFGVKSVHIIVYNREQEHMVFAREDCYYINYFADAIPVDKITRKFISQIIIENYQEYKIMYEKILEKEACTWSEV